MQGAMIAIAAIGCPRPHVAPLITSRRLTVRLLPRLRRRDQRRHQPPFVCGYSVYGSVAFMPSRIGPPFSNQNRFIGFSILPDRH
jgi:hypothetical protein